MAIITGTANADSITPAGVSPGVTGGVPSDAADSILGGSGADTLDGGGGNDFVKGQNGDDTLIGNDGDDHLGAGRGDDTVEGGAGNDRLRGHTGDDVLRGGAGNDWLEGDAPLTSANYVAGADVLRGGGGDDRLIGFGGADTYFGGDGDDILVLHDLDFATIDGGTGGDKLKAAAAGLDLDFTGALGDTITGIETLDLRGGDHTVTLDAASVTALGSETGKLKVLGGDTDAVALSEEFALSGHQVRGPTTFDLYTADGATIWVEDDVAVTIDGDGSPPPTQSPVVDLADLDGTNGFLLAGDEYDRSGRSNSGRSVSGAGDVNGDGFDDVIIGAPFAYVNYDRAVGVSYVVFGSDDPFPDAIALSTLDGGNGFVLEGTTEEERAGWSVSGAGDVNGDGFDDLIIGGSGADEDERGRSFVVFGSGNDFEPSFDLSGLDGANGFQRPSTGGSVSNAGDVNGDGFDDLIYGPDIGGGYYAGYFIVEFGASDPANSRSIRVDGIGSNDRLGRAVSGAGDVNGDGFDDVIANDEIFTYVIFGSDGDLPVLADLDGNNGFAFRVGFSTSGALSSAGDINGDGFDDVIIGSSQTDTNGPSSGASYVIFGSDARFARQITPSELDSTNGFVINGIDA